MLFFATKLEFLLQSRKVGDAAYNSEWYSSPFLASHIKMIIIRTTKPIILTAGGIAEINKNTIKSVRDIKILLTA